MSTKTDDKTTKARPTATVTMPDPYVNMDVYYFTAHGEKWSARVAKVHATNVPYRDANDKLRHHARVDVWVFPPNGGMASFPMTVDLYRDQQHTRRMMMGPAGQPWAEYPDYIVLPGGEIG